jgi:serine/threonine-protein kinase
VYREPAARGIDPATADLSGRYVGASYLLVCPIGQGATGTVWRGIDRNSGEAVASGSGTCSASVRRWAW